MVELNHTVDPNMQSSGGDYPLIPAGDYVGEIVEAQDKTSKNGHRYLSLQIRVEGHGLVFDNLNLWHPNPKAQTIANERLNAIGIALGMRSINDTDQLLAKKLGLSVSIENDNTGKPRNIVDAYKSVAAGALPPPPAAATAADPPAAAWRGRV